MRFQPARRFASRSLIAKLAIGFALVTIPMLSQTASAYTLRNTQQVVLSWRPSDPPSVIHAALIRQARRACAISSAYSMEFRRIEKRCVADVMNQAVARIGSVDLSRHHLEAGRPSRG